MFVQKEIFEWLDTLNVNQIKHILTVKNPNSIAYLIKIMSFEPNSKPIDRILHGYSETKFQDKKGFYLREKYRYKSKKDDKIAMDKVLFENITVSRVNSLAFSVRKSFIQSGELKRCLLLFSDGNAFSFYDVKQMHVKLGEEKNLKSLWFEPTYVKSFSEWMVHFFEIEIFTTYHLLKKGKSSPVNEFNHFTFVEENITKENIRNYVSKVLEVYSEKRHNGKYAKKTSKKEGLFGFQEEDQELEPLEVTVEEVPYITNRCMQRLEEGQRGIEEVVFEYVWYSEDKTSKVNRILADICKIIVRKFRDYELDCKAKEIDALNQTKKKKKRGKKPKDQKQEEPQKIQQRKIEEISNQSLIDKSEDLKGLVLQNSPKVQQSYQSQQTSTDSKPVLQEQLKKQEMKSQDQKYQDPKETLKKSVKTKAKPKQKKQISVDKIQLSQKQELLTKKVNLDREKQDVKKARKIVKQRINQHILSYYQQLSLSSQSIDKYRKICIETIENTIMEMELKFKWELVIFGSYSIEFSLRESDLDILVVVSDPEFSLTAVREHFKVQQWLRGCNIIQIQSAKVNILQFQIILSCLKHPKLKDPKKLKEVLHVDLSLTSCKDRHEGIRNTSIMKDIFNRYPNMKVVSLILKELLRIYELNKPFSGGIGSYVLVILVHNIIKMKGLEVSKDYFKLLIEVCTFMTEQFEPYKTLISPDPDTKLESNPKLQLNIEDPDDKVILNTTKIRQINEIVQVFNQLRTHLTAIESQLSEISVQERKKMKRSFFQKWNILFKPNQQFTE